MNTSSQITEANKLIQDKKLVEARVILKQVLAQDKTNANAWLLFADTMSDKLVQLECYKKALAIDPQDKIAVRRYEDLKLELANTELLADTKHMNAKERQQLALGKVITTAKANLGELSYPFLGLLALSAFVIGFIFFGEKSLNTIILAGLFSFTALGFLIWIVIRLGYEVSIWENGITAKWYGNQRMWLWTDFYDVKMKNKKIFHADDDGFSTELKPRFTLLVQEGDKRGHLLFDERYTHHAALGRYITDCVQNQGIPSKSLKSYFSKAS